jgi:serine/threonine protein kinase
MILSNSGRTYILTSKLGKGTFGSVSTCIDSKTGNEFAYKYFEQDDDMHGLEPGGLRELGILKKLNHPSIINIIDYVIREGELGLVLPKALFTLETAIIYDFLNQDNKKKIAIQLLDAVSYMRSIGIMHRDIKPDNILLFQDDTDPKCPYSIKLADFSLSTYAITEITDSHTPGAGTCCYRAPEIVNNEDGMYNINVDDWSIGVVLLELFYGKLNGSIDTKTFKKIKKIKNNLDNGVISVIIHGLLDVNPDTRINCITALKMLNKKVKYVTDDLLLPGIDPIKSVKKISLKFDIQNPITIRMASYFVYKTNCDKRWAIIFASKLFEIKNVYQFEDDDFEKEQYEQAEISIIKDLDWDII